MSEQTAPGMRGGTGGAPAEASGMELRRIAEACAAEATRQGRPQVLALCIELPAFDPLVAFTAAGDTERFFFERPSEELAVAARGVVRAIETSGPDRFREAGRLARETLASVYRAGCRAPTGTGGPLLVGGFAFGDGPAPDRGGDTAAGEAPSEWSGFPPGRLVLPEVLLVRSGACSVCTVLRAVAPGADPARECETLRAQLDRELSRAGAVYHPLRPSASAGPEAERASGGAPSDDAHLPAEAALEHRIAAEPSHAAYRARVAAALDAVAAGDLEKVVAARSVRVSRAAPFPAHSVVAALRRVHPTCATFAVGRPGAVFLGATPERLVRVSGRRVFTAAVAGSAPRGLSPEEDARLARSLVESKKEQAEHAVTVRALRAALADLCPELQVPEAPRLLRLDGIQHLETPVAGTLRDGCTLLDVAGRLHPTPAVGGAPRDAALAWLARSGEPERGWYSGPVGFLDAEGGGELCVALRSALLRGGEARLFAGAGVVAGSDPDSELRETRLKLRAMLDPLLEI